MAVYVCLTSFLCQRGSAESKDPDESQEVDEEPEKHRFDPDEPRPVRTHSSVIQTCLISILISKVFRPAQGIG